MLAVLRRNPVALVLAILLHVALGVFLILEVDWRDEVKPIGGDVQVVQAQLVDQRELEAEQENSRPRNGPRSKRPPRQSAPKRKNSRP